jgi:hypothetical protein
LLKFVALYTTRNQKGKKTRNLFDQSTYFPLSCKEVLADDEGKVWDASGGKESRVFSWSEKEYFQDETAESMRGTCVVAVWWVGAS